MPSLVLATLNSVILLCFCDWKPIHSLESLQSPGDLKVVSWNDTGTPARAGLVADGTFEMGKVTDKTVSVHRPFTLKRSRRGASALNASNSVFRDTMTPKATTCIYKLITEGHGNSRICFRTLDSDFSCNQRNCKVYRSGRSLTAYVLRNSSVLLQWQPQTVQDLKGFSMNCTWNGTYTRFQCDNVQLGASCRDYLVTNVHDNVKYRICLQALYINRSDSDDCVEFMVEPAGMQDIVIAMTAVGGSICVMLVIICLLVAYITENLMHPVFTQSSSKRGHQDHNIST
nr:PREDICTED: fibronectin type-III domain-containing transmembrane protein C1orf233 homolog [Latimeria chalumnae]|eukprot:XP_005986168.1 PREDICTED: fibronectin type-III domain-containing transmembrane protein C1orf233 homolog [Latimeria chalumnae]